MPSPKRWLQSSANGGEDGGAENGATGSLAGEVALEAVMPGAAEEQLGRITVAEIPNEGMVPNVDMTDVAEDERRGSSAQQTRTGVKRPWDETGGINTEFAAAVLEVLQRHGVLTTSSSSSGRRMVSQEIQTELSGEVSAVQKRSQNKMTESSSASSLCVEGGDEKEGKG